MNSGLEPRLILIKDNIFVDLDIHAEISDDLIVIENMFHTKFKKLIALN